MVLFFLFGFIIILIYVYYTRNDNYWKERGVPYEDPKFFFGNFKEVIKGSKHFGVMYMDLYRKFKDVPYVGYFKLDSPGIVVRDPELVKTVLTKEFNSFMDNDFKVDPEVDPFWSSNVFSQTGEEWKKNRTAWSLGMTASKIKGTQEVMLNKSKFMIGHLKRVLKNNAEENFESITLVSNYFTDVTVTSALGLECNSFETTDNPFRYITKNFLIRNFWDGLAMLTFLIAPWLGRLLKLKFVPSHIQNVLMQLSERILEERRKNGYQKNNVFDSMLMYVGDVHDVTVLDVAGFLFNFLFDGTETSAGVAGYALYELAKCPDVQQKLRDEIKQSFKENGEDLSYDSINEMKYLDTIIQETMRLYPVTLAIQRVCTKDYTFPPINGKAVQIPVGMSVIVPTLALHMDAEFFPEPEKFDPDRFNDENKTKFPKYAHLPFGEGPRICIGIRLAQFQMKIALIELVRNFQIKLSPKTEDPLPIDPNIFLMRPTNGIWITLHELK